MIKKSVDKDISHVNFNLIIKHVIVNCDRLIRQQSNNFNGF